jgi:hypothetical protein
MPWNRAKLAISFEKYSPEKTRSRAVLPGELPAPERRAARQARGNDLREVKLNTAPKIIAAMPPMIIHIDLSVGLSVNARETSELKESAALMPKISRMIPAANKANPNALFIMVVSRFPGRAKLVASPPGESSAFGQQPHSSKKRSSSSRVCPVAFCRRPKSSSSWPSS